MRECENAGSLVQILWKLMYTSMSKLETTKVRGCGSGSGSVPGKCGNAADEWHDAIRMFWWNMDAGNCSAYGVYLFRLFICSFKTRASIQFLYTVQLCMLQGKFQEFKYIVIYCIATLFLTKYCTGTYHNMRSAHWWYDDLMEQSILG